MGNSIYKRFGDEIGIHLHQKSFLFGNILPDIVGSYLIKPHFLDNYQKRIKKRIQKLLSKNGESVDIGRSFSRELGIICHYYADFFCYPHTSRFRGDIASHIRYEKQLFTYLSKGSYARNDSGSILQPTGDIDADIVMKHLKLRCDAYSDISPSFCNDISFAMDACFEVVLLIICAACDERKTDYTLCYS